MLASVLLVLLEIAAGSGTSQILRSLMVSGNSPVPRGQTAEIYCDYNDRHVTIVSIQWYKYDGDEKIPVYSYVFNTMDQSKGPIEGRAELRHKYGRFTLLIHDMSLKDEGLYQCQLFHSFSSQLTSRKYVLKVSIPASTPIIESKPHLNGSGLTVHCSGNVGRPGGSLVLYQLQNNNWTRLETYEIQRVYANHTVTTFVKTSVRTDGLEKLYIKCQAKNDGVNEPVFTTEKLIQVPVYSSGSHEPAGTTDSGGDGTLHVAGIATIALLLVAGILFAAYMAHRFTNLSLTRCIKKRRSPNNVQSTSCVA